MLRTGYYEVIKNPVSIAEMRERARCSRQENVHTHCLLRHRRMCSVEPVDDLRSSSTSRQVIESHSPSVLGNHSGRIAHSLLRNGTYSSIADLDADMSLMVANAQAYNSSDSQARRPLDLHLPGRSWRGGLTVGALCMCCLVSVGTDTTSSTLGGGWPSYAFS